VNDLNANPKGTTDEDKDLPLLPVLPSWGSIFRETPSRGYGDMRFDQQQVVANARTSEPSRLDVSAAADLEKSLPL
jgi:hypothetical protein